MSRDNWHRLEMLVAADWLDDLDKWRAQQAEIPSRAVAIRHLVTHAIANSDVADPRMLPRARAPIPAKREGIVSRAIRLTTHRDASEAETAS